MATQCMLTTKDNPYDPFNQFDSWFIYDVTNGYNTCGYLARIAHTSDALTEPENNAEIERAIRISSKFKLVLSCFRTSFFKS